MLIINLKKINKSINYINLGLGIGDWGLGIGDWGLAQSPIPNHIFIYEYY